MLAAKIRACIIAGKNLVLLAAGVRDSFKGKKWNKNYKVLEWKIFYDRTIGTKRVVTNSVGTKRVGTKRVGTKRVGTERVGTNSVGSERVGTNNVVTERVGTNSVGTITWYRYIKI